MNSVVLKSNPKIKLNELLKEMTSGEVKWVALLCKYGSEFELVDILNASKCVVFGIMKYRRILREKDIGTVSLIEINTAYTNNNLDRLHNLLQEMFLEPISGKQYGIIKSKLDKTQGGIEKLYKKHLEDKNLRVLSVVKIL